jgi:hypothetical protein
MPGSAADDLAVAGHMLCCECKVHRGAPDCGSFRCGDCNSLKSRVTRLLKRGGHEHSASFKDLSKEEKVEFFAKNSKCMGEELSVAVQDVITRVLKKTEEVEFKGTGEFIDEPDLREKYANKPEQANAIIKNSRSMFDSIRETTLYEDMAYSSKVAQNEKLETSSGQSSTHDRYVKAKTVKKTKGPAVKAEHTEQTGALSEAQKTSLGHLVAEITEANGRLDVELQNIETNAVKEFMVQASVTQAEACGFKLKEFVAIVAVAVDSSTGDFNDLKSQHRDLKTDGKDQVRRLKGQIKAAMALKTEWLTPKIAKGSKRKAAQVKEPPKVADVE